MTPQQIENIELQVAQIHSVIVGGAPAEDDLVQAARSVVEWRYYQGPEGYDSLMAAISRLEELVGRL